MNPNSRYWERRLAEDMFDEMSKVETSFADIAKLFTQALLYMQAQAEDIFEKYRDKHGLSDEEARELLHRMNDPANLKEMQERLRNTADSAEKKELVRKLEAPAYQERIRRAEELRKNINTIMEDLAAKEEEKGEEILKEAADDGYYEAIYRTQQRADAGFSFSELNPELVDEAIHTNFNGKEFSERVWGNTGKLAEVLKEELAVGILTQRAERETALAIAQRMGKGLMEARRLVRTESNRLYTEFAMKGLEEAGVEEYMFLATLDLRTSEMCREHDGKIYKVKERKTGDNCPPLHPWCRSTVMGIISRALLSRLKRDALDPATGKRVKVPLSMTYEEWYKKYVKGNTVVEAKEKGIKNKSSDIKQHRKYKKILPNKVPENLDDFQQMKYNKTEEWDKVKNTKQDTINAMSIEDVKKLNGMLGNQEARLWYKAQDAQIPDSIDKSLSLEEQARQAHELRNRYRTQGRDLMIDQEARKKLDEEKPNLSFEEMLQHKKDKYGLTGDDAYRDIIRSSTTTNQEYDEKAGIGKKDGKSL